MSTYSPLKTSRILMYIEQLLPLISFAFVMSISPGPGNLLLLTSGANFGLTRTIPLILGISFGFLFMVLIVGVGLGELITLIPGLSNLLKVACIIYVLWLAYQIAKSAGINSSNNSLSKPMSFIQATLLQWLNPKAWTVSLIITVTYTVPEHFMISLVSTIFVFALINIPSISLWAISGSALKRFLLINNRIKYFNLTMSLILVASMVPMIITN